MSTKNNRKQYKKQIALPTRLPVIDFFFLTYLIKTIQLVAERKMLVSLVA